MAGLITQTEMMKYAGMSKAVFPAGTIFTPSAKDYAAENNISIVIGGACDAVNNPSACETEKEVLLKQVVKSVIENAEKTGRKLSKEEMAKTVSACLERVGCRIEG